MGFLCSLLAPSQSVQEESCWMLSITHLHSEMIEKMYLPPLFTMCWVSVNLVKLLYYKVMALREVILKLLPLPLYFNEEETRILFPKVTKLVSSRART